LDQLPIFVNLKGRNVILVGEGEMADAKRRLIERAGGICVDAADRAARIAFVAIAEEDEARIAADDLKARGLLVNVVDRPEICDFTTPAIVDRTPVLIAVGTGGASAGMAKAIRQRIETLLPETLGPLAEAISGARSKIRARWSEGAQRRRALDQGFAAGGMLDPFGTHDDATVDNWIMQAENPKGDRLIEIALLSADPDDLTLRTARLLGEADNVFHDPGVPAAILNRARADAVRHASAPPAPPPEGLSLFLRLPLAQG
jgi:uroporphyrin-III C-methyltransferase/precorrin-2 dehydrogenase/sirohydrochlorin ferrochelatase